MRWYLSSALAAVPAGRTLLIKLLEQNASRLDLRRFSIDTTNATHVRRLPLILQAFLQGYNEMLRSQSLADVREALLEIAPHFQGFAFEGAGMGYGARCFLRRARPEAFEQAIHELGLNNLFQYYVGLGWWLAERYGLQRQGYDRWFVHLDPRYRSIIYDGVGFRLGFFHYHKNSTIHHRFHSLGSDALPACYQGFGRALWFCLHGESNAILTAANRLSEQNRHNFLSGIGLASAYSTVDTPNISLSLPSDFPTSDHPALWQGIAFGWEARNRQNPEYFRQCTTAIAREGRAIADLLETVHKAHDDAGARCHADLYVAWLAETRNAIARTG